MVTQSLVQTYMPYAKKIVLSLRVPQENFKHLNVTKVQKSLRNLVALTQFRCRQPIKMLSTLFPVLNYRGQPLRVRHSNCRFARRTGECSASFTLSLARWGLLSRVRGPKRASQKPISRRKIYYYNEWQRTNLVTKNHLRRRNL